MHSVVLKNDRGGDLMVSLKCISSLIEKDKEITIFLSEFNESFRFLFKDIKVKKLKFDLNIYEKIKLFYFILTNEIDEIYILSPKSYYFYLPFIFRKIKFYAIVIDGEKRYRPALFLRKYLYKYEVVNRKNKVNKTPLEQMQLNLVSEAKLDKNFIYNLNFPSNINFIDSSIPKNFYFFQFKKNFFEEINWDLKKLDKFFSLLLSKVENIVFCSDIENTNYNKSFLQKYPYINFESNVPDISNKKDKILYLHNVTGENLFYVVKLSKKVICPHGLISWISKINQIPTVALFNFKITNKKDYLRQKISFSVWYPKKSFDFAFLNTDFEKALKKISTRI